MQFHLNGFRAGSPEVCDPVAQVPNYETLPSEVDVLIVGSGPAGLTLAAQLASFPDINTWIVEAKPGAMKLGQADGIACRSMEMFEAFGFSDRVMKEGYWVNETTFWKPDPEQRQNIARSGRIQDTEEGLSEFPHMILNQARVHDLFLEVMANSPRRLQPTYSHRLVDLVVSAEADCPDDFCVEAQLEVLGGEDEGETQTVRARYLVGCDGARSAVRKSMGLKLKGDSANKAWGVMDVLGVTDFPDIRLKTLIQSESEGTILIIPREGGYLARFYVELEALKDDQRVRNQNITSDDLVKAAGRILYPYTLEAKEIPWWSVYEIGQRLCDKFDNSTDDASGPQDPRVFIAGDACHTHSPKAGQGMNVSMRDSFNLGWKLAAVLSGRCAPEILHTYSSERQAVAQQLIDFDRTWAKIMSARANPTDGVGADSSEGGAEADDAEFDSFFVRSGRYTAGTGIFYQPSILVGEMRHQELATGFGIGARLHSAPVVRLSDAKAVHLAHTVKADGRWRLFAFDSVGDSAAPSVRMQELCEFVADSPESPVVKFTPAGRDIDSVIDVRAVFPHNHRKLPLETMPPLLLPKKGRFGLIDYQKAFCHDRAAGRDIFELRGIADKGCLVVVRPDQHVAHVLPLDAHDQLVAFFDAFMLAPAGP